MVEKKTTGLTHAQLEVLGYTGIKDLTDAFALKHEVYRTARKVFTFKEVRHSDIKDDDSGLEGAELTLLGVPKVVEEKLFCDAKSPIYPVLRDALAQKLKDGNKDVINIKFDENDILHEIEIAGKTYTN
jgi:hypothetical protein